MRRRLRFVATLWFVSMSFLTGPTWGQGGGADNRALEEVIVTSRKLGAENVQDIPAAITAIGSDVLKDMQVVDFEDFARQVPGLTFLDTSPGERRYVIRGVQSAGQQQVAVYYDEIPLPGVQSSTSDSGSQTTDLKLYDIERVEVLRGPQGTVFGANSQAGTVRFISRQPVLGEYDAYASAELSRTSHSADNNTNLHAVVNLPLTDNLATRILVYDGEDAGYIDNHRCRATDPAEDPRLPDTALSCLDQEDYNTIETTGLRTNVLWAPSDALTLKGQFWWQDRQTGGDQRYHPYDTFGVRPGTDNGDTDNVAGFAFFDTGKFVSGDFALTPKPDEQTIYSLVAEFGVPFADVTAAVSRYERDFKFKFDSSWIITFLLQGDLDAGLPSCGAPGADPAACLRSDLLFALTDQRQDLEQNAIEIRLNSKNADSPIQWVAGAFYRKRETNFQSFVPVVNAQGVTFDPATPFTIPPTSDPGAGIPGCHPCVFARTDSKEIDETAVFGEINWSITETLDLNVGARWFDVDQTEVGALLFDFSAFAPNPPDSTPSVNNLSDSETPWKIALAWHASDDVTLYGVRSNGFRLGGTNNRGIGAIQIPEEFGSDELTNYEFGVKSTLADNRVVLNASAFLMKWENLQVAGEDPTGAFGFIGNAGKAEIQGAETDISAWIGDNLHITGQLTYLWQKELTEDQVSSELVAPGLDGDQIPRIPEFTVGFAAQYNYQLQLPEWDGFVRLEGSYTDDSRTELRPGSTNDRIQEDYSIVNARFGFSNDDRELDLILFLDNVFDEDGDVFIQAANGQPTSKISNRPRTIGLQITKGFGGN